MMSQHGFHFDMNRCYACQACDIACKDWNDIDPGAEKLMCVYEWESGTFPDVRIHNLAFSCGHCDNPACMAACETGAIFKEDKYGAVLVDFEKCNGCRKCYEACPYGAPKFASDEPGEKMRKCDMCIDRLEAGEPPVCAATCPLRAFDFGPVDDLVAKYGDVRYCPGMPDPSITKPNYLIWNQREKQQLLPYDADKAIELNRQRGHLGTMFDSASDLSEFEDGTIGRDGLRMKFSSNAELLRATRNDMA